MVKGKGDAVMYPSYHGALCALRPDDLAGLDSIY
jgi:hypothetical protein